mgnify:CR=1 FL=1
MSKIVGSVLTFAYLKLNQTQNFWVFLTNHQAWKDHLHRHYISYTNNLTFKFLVFVVMTKYFFNADTMSFDDTEIEETIKVCHDANDGYILCPHTAVAVKYYYKMKLDQQR